MSFQATGFTDTQTWVTDKAIVESVLDSDTEVSLQTFSNAIAAILGGANGIPAIYKAEDLLLLGNLDFDDTYGLQNLKEMTWGGDTKVAYISGYGAVGDGSTSDRSAFINALTDLTAAGGGILYLDEPSADYLIDDEIDFATGTDFPAGVPSNIRIVGLGEGVQLTLDTGAGDNMFDLNETSGIVFENIRFQTDNNNGGQGAGRFIADMGNYCKILRCRFNGGGSMDGAFNTGGASSDWQSILIEDVTVDGTFEGHIIDINNTRQMRMHRLTMKPSAGTPLTCIRIYASSAGNGNEDLVIDGLYIQRQVGTAGHAAINIATNHSAERIVITNFAIDAEVSGEAAIEVEGDNVLICNGHISTTDDASGSNGIDLVGSLDTTIMNVTIAGPDGRDSTPDTSCEAAGIALTGAPDGCIINSCRISGYNHTNGRGVKGAGITPINLQMTSNIIWNCGTNVDTFAGTAWNYAYHTNDTSTTTGVNMEV